MQACVWGFFCVSVCVCVCVCVVWDFLLQREQMSLVNLEWFCLNKKSTQKALHEGNACMNTFFSPYFPFVGICIIFKCFLW